MANKRMFSIDVTETDTFLEMPLTAQALYFHLAMRGDDDGFVSNPRSIMRVTGCSENDLKTLAESGYIITFRSGVIVISDWKVNKASEAGRTLLQTIEQNSADNAKLADKLNGVAGAAIDTIVKVMQAADTPNESKLKAAQTLLKARQDVTDRLLRDEEKKRESSFDPFS